MLEIPSVIHRDTNGNERPVSLISRLLSDRIVMVTGEITDTLAESVVAQLLYLESESTELPINLMIMGPGGSVTAGFAIISTMQALKCPVYTTIIGEVASMSAVIAVSGEKGHRNIYKNSRVMLHTVAAGVQGKIQDMQITLDEVQRVNKKVMLHLSSCLDKKLEVLEKDLDRDFWLDENEAISYGCCDTIVEKHK